MKKQFLAALVCHEALTKRDAFAALHDSLGFRIRNEGSPDPVMVMSASSWLTIDIPKFGEAPPLTLDVWSSKSVDAAREAALDLASQITENIGWNVTTDFEAR